MKIRTDFITNSSSSAFVVVGAKLSHNDMDKYYGMWKELEEKNLRLFGEERVIGRVIANLDYENSFTSIVMSYSSLENVFVEVEDILAELGIDNEVCLMADLFFS